MKASAYLWLALLGLPTPLFLLFFREYPGLPFDLERSGYRPSPRPETDGRARPGLVMKDP